MLATSTTGAGFNFAGLHLGKIDDRLGDVVDVIGINVQSHVGGDFNDLSIGQAGGTGMLDCGIADETLLHNYGQSKLQNRVILTGNPNRLACVSSVVLIQTGFAAKKSVGAQAIVAVIALGDGDADLFADFATQNAPGKGSGETQIALKRSGGIGQYAGQIWHDSELGLDGVEQLLGFASRAGGIDLLGSAHRVIFQVLFDTTSIVPGFPGSPL